MEVQHIERQIEANIVVGINEPNISPSSGLKTRVSRSSWPLVILGENRDRALSRALERTQNFKRVVGRTVVDENQLHFLAITFAQAREKVGAFKR